MTEARLGLSDFAHEFPYSIREVMYLCYQAVGSVHETVYEDALDYTKTTHHVHDHPGVSIQGRELLHEKRMAE